MLKDPPANAGDARDLGLIPGSGRSLGGGNGNLLQYSCLENPMDKEAWWAMIQNTRTQLNDQVHCMNTIFHLHAQKRSSMHHFSILKFLNKLLYWSLVD